jgi:hypothetical protein
MIQYAAEMPLMAMDRILPDWLGLNDVCLAAVLQWNYQLLFSSLC